MVTRGVGASMGEVDRFVSQFTNRFDAKGRITVPAPFRTVMTRDGFDGLYLCQSLYQPALDGGGHRFLADVESLLSGLTPHSEPWDMLATAVYGTSETSRVDPEGRIALSETMRAYAGLTEAATFVGLGRKFQIWEPARFATHLAEAKRRVQAIQTDLAAPGSAGANRSGAPEPGARE